MENLKSFPLSGFSSMGAKSPWGAVSDAKASPGCRTSCWPLVELDLEGGGTNWGRVFFHELSQQIRWPGSDGEAHLRRRPMEALGGETKASNVYKLSPTKNGGETKASNVSTFFFQIIIYLIAARWAREICRD